ncbi:PspC domain-containing protein [Sphingomonas montanisoli]|uniref:PspC domain-containing protein n=1 Tax=Sphingomonas montanisoli TaxID=2606412 RepID=A0A5D9C7S8_9SPHN|nr:PspC domain-containing protein [Sphingomonas montanisoli]TZG26115.1 PspC domain-containing protein [Sphingomonas montanisoli]
MERANGKYFDRADTMFGVCEGIGTELGFNPNILRMAIGVCLLLSPKITIGVYVALGILLFAAYKLMPSRKRASVVEIGQRSERADDTQELAQAA